MIKAVPVSLALLDIQASPVSKVTRDFQAHRDFRVNQVRGVSQVSLSKVPRETEGAQDNLEKQEPQELQDLLVFQAETAQKETKESRVAQAFREKQDIRVTQEDLDFLDNPAFQVLMDRRVRRDCRASMASQV